MDNSDRSILFKKLLIFGAEGVGKTTLTFVLQHNSYSEEEPSVESNYIL